MGNSTPALFDLVEYITTDIDKDESSMLLSTTNLFNNKLSK